MTSDRTLVRIYNSSHRVNIGDVLDFILTEGWEFPYGEGEDLIRTKWIPEADQAFL